MKNETRNFVIAMIGLVILTALGLIYIPDLGTILLVATIIGFVGGATCLPERKRILR